MPIFPTAPIARQQVTNKSILIQEIAIMELAIISAIPNETFAVLSSTTAVTINGVTITGSPMTLDPLYYDAWKLNNSAVKVAEMNEIIAYFVSLGYAISRKSNISGTTLDWQLSW